MPGAMTPAEREHIFNLIRTPATQELGMQLLDRYVLPQQHTAITGHQYFGTPGGGQRPLPEPGTPTEQPGSQHVFGLGVPALPPGSLRGTPFGVDLGGDGGNRTTPQSGEVNSKGYPVHKDGSIDQERLDDWLKQGWRPGG